MRKEKENNIGLTALLNSKLVCKDCKHRNEKDYAVASCEAFTDMKPKGILFKGENCPEYEKE